LLAETASQKPIERRSSCLKKIIFKLKVTSNLGVFDQKCRYLLMQTGFQTGFNPQTLPDEAKNFSFPTMVAGFQNQVIEMP